MKKLYVFEFEGLKYYVVNGGTTINITYDNVNIGNYLDVRDINCFSVNEPINNYDEFETTVIDVIGNEKLHDLLLNDLEKIIDSNTAYKIVNKIENCVAYREAYILANYESLKVEGNLLHIYSTDRNGFTVDFRLNERTLGEIVG